MSKENIFQPDLKIKNISIKNFRGFGQVQLDFNSKLNVIIGVNGSGKTTILDCIAKTLSIFLHKLYQKKYGESIQLKDYFDVYDIKNSSFQIDIATCLSYGEQEINIEFSFEKEYQSEAILHPVIDELMDKIHQRIQFQQPINLPLFAYYPAVKAPLDFIDFSFKGNNLATNIIEAYGDVLSKKYFDFNSFFSWYIWQENIEKQTGESKILESVRNAIYSILSDDNAKFDNLSINWINQPAGEMIIDKNGISLNINQLSSGEKLLLVLVADMVRRLAFLNPHRLNPLEGYGIVLIDEIELHLHPQWQRVIIPQLQKTFPGCQFIVTTHSPLVLSNVEREDVFILEDFKIVEITPHTKGRDSNSILYELQGVEERPKQFKQKLLKFYRLIDDEKLEEARAVLLELTEKFGDHDTEIVRANMHLDFLIEE